MEQVTIVIPVYNTEKYLRRAIESCLHQTSENIEIVVVNDGSTDDSLTIAQSYLKKHNNLKVISTENQGLSMARNTGLREAKGKYIYFLDSDDWIEADTIESCYNLAENNRLDIVTFDSKTEVDSSLSDFDENNVNYYERNRIIDSTRIYSGKDFIELYKDKNGVAVPTWLFFIKREFLIGNNIWFLPNAYYEDVAFHYTCFLRVKRLMYLPRPFHVRLYRRNSIMTSSLNARKVCSVYEIIIEMCTKLQDTMRYKENIWVQYLLKLVWDLGRTVMFNVLRKDIEHMKNDFSIINLLQIECVKKYYNILDSFERKVSNVEITLRFAGEIITPLGWVSKQFLDILEEIIKERELIIKQKFSRLPLRNKDIKVGIYGSGNHTEILLEKYKEVIGDINADIIFIDSYKKSYTETYQNYNIININDINETDITEIVILSYFYENEMYNNIVERYSDKYIMHRIYNNDPEPLDSTSYLKRYERLVQIHKNGRKKIILINTPLHTNIGDHLITVAEQKFFENYLPDYDIMEISNKAYHDNRKKVMYQVNVDDIIVITGGGFIGSLWPYSGDNVAGILRDFPDNKIIILPQSMYYEDNPESLKLQKVTKELFVGHGDLTVCFREDFSVNRAINMFREKVNWLLMPDMALTLDYSKEQNIRNGIGICLRSDKESLLSESDKEIIKKHFLDKGNKVSLTSMHWHSDIQQNQRDEIISKKIDELKKYQLVITDTLHCMISCAISGTPCIALDNISHKVKGIYRTWLKYLGYIRFVDFYEDIFHIDFNDWKEIEQKNYYNQSYDKNLRKLACIISANNEDSILGVN